MEEQMIEFIKKNTILYDRNHKDYKNTLKKDRRWNQLATIVNQPVLRVKNRWKTMRDRYFRIRKIKKLEEERGSPSLRKYKYYDRLDFLKECEPLKPSELKEYDVVQPIHMEDSSYDDSAETKFDVTPNGSSFYYTEDTQTRNTCEDPLDRSVIQESYLSVSSGGAKNKEDLAPPPIIDIVPDTTQIAQVNTQQLPLCDGIDHYFLGIASVVRQHNLSVSDLLKFQVSLLNFVNIKLNSYVNK